MIANKLRKAYGSKGKRVEAVKGVERTIGRGVIPGFPGSSGAGKTTTLRMLCPLLRPDSRDAWIGGFEPVGPAARVRTPIGYVSQDGEHVLLVPRRLFDAEHMGHKTITFARPTLDNIFLKETGRALEES